MYSMLVCNAAITIWGIRIFHTGPDKTKRENMNWKEISKIQKSSHVLCFFFSFTLFYRVCVFDLWLWWAITCAEKKTTTAASYAYFIFGFVCNKNWTLIEITAKYSSCTLDEFLYGSISFYDSHVQLNVTRSSDIFFISFSKIHPLYTRSSLSLSSLSRSLLFPSRSIHAHISPNFERIANGVQMRPFCNALHLMRSKILQRILVKIKCK